MSGGWWYITERLTGAPGWTTTCVLSTWPGLSHNMLAGLPVWASQVRTRQKLDQNFYDWTCTLHTITSAGPHSLVFSQPLPRFKGREQIQTPSCFGSSVAYTEVHEYIGIFGKCNLPHTVYIKLNFLTLKPVPHPLFSSAVNKTNTNSVAQAKRWASSLTAGSLSSPFQ